MKVIKFGGTSVGSAESIQKVKSIILSQPKDTVVVVSAVGGVTDKLIEAAEKARSGDESFRALLSSLSSTHSGICKEVSLPSNAARTMQTCGELMERLRSLCEGVFMLKVLPQNTLEEIVSFGERLSSVILSSSIEGAVLYDALDFIRTRRRGKINIADTTLTYSLIRETFRGYTGESGVAIVPGFIARDAASSEVTNLGRGGSDYSASLIAAALDAEVLEIWTDVDGFMTADPHIIKTSYTIDEMSYEEAMELCNFGAKVVYPPTLYAVCGKGIPIVVRNTFNPDCKGTTIKRECRPSDKLIRGISSIDDICIITLSGTSMVGIIGIDSRIFSSLAREGISAFLVSQSASETGISIGVSKDDADAALEALNEEFRSETASGSIAPVELRRDLAAVAVVLGKSMRHHAGTAGKLFSTLGRNGINIIACAQGASETSISIIVERKNLRKSLNVIHDSFFLSEYQELNLFICGVGTVGGHLIEQIKGQREKLMRERNLKINIVGIARSTKAVFDRSGIDLSCYRELLEKGQDTDTAKLGSEVIEMNIFNSVFVDCTASSAVADLYEDFFKRGISVVAANKIAASSPYEHYRALKDTARLHNVKFLFETNVGAGLPIINTINDLRDSGDHILRMEAVLSGTLNFIFNTISSDIPFSKAVKMAQEQGYSEPDPRVDLSGKDVIRKLVILSREAGYKVNQEDVEVHLFIPKELFECSTEEFFERLPSLDAAFESRRQELEKEGRRQRFVASMENGKCKVELREIERGHSFYRLDDSNNIILLTTERYNKHPMLIQGYGAGADVTAAGVFADIMSIANV